MLQALYEEKTPTTSLVDMIQEQLAAAAAMQEQLARLVSHSSYSYAGLRCL
jgi:hypothetical protein